MRSRLFRTMGASLSLAASIALSAGSGQALDSPGRGGSTAQSNLAQSQAHWLFGGDPSDLSSNTQQRTAGQLDLHERNENGPFALGSRVEGGDVAQANVALASAENDAATAQEDQGQDATSTGSVDQALLGQAFKRLQNRSQPVAVWSRVEAGDVAQANVDRGNASNGSSTVQETQPSSSDLPASITGGPGPDRALEGVAGPLQQAMGSDTPGGTSGAGPVAPVGAPSGSQSASVASSGQPGLAVPSGGQSASVASSGQPGLAAPSGGPGLAASAEGSAAAAPGDRPASTADPVSSTTDQAAVGQLGIVQVNVNDPVTVLSRVQSGDVEQANVALGRASNQSRTHQSDPNDPSQVAAGQAGNPQINVNAPVTVLSRVQGGDVRQANISSGEASNRATTAQESSGEDLVSDGTADLTPGSMTSSTQQAAAGQLGVTQVNVNAPVTVLSRVRSGDVEQANVALGQATNQSRTHQESSALPSA
ncbi:MAG TPA: hypothetical protein VFD49_14855 [Candidatus Dormibacteraeota bacterium]|nr:hypothetical protein [Candidatus Dormibacteraeota bacterium]